MRRYPSLSLSPPRIRLGYIPKGYLGTQKTLQHIKTLIQAGAKDFYVRQHAIDVLFQKGVKAKDYLGEIKALFEWVQQNVRYTKDPFRVEVLHSARRMLALRAGDCDDMTILLGSLLEAIGHPVRLVITGPDPLRPQLFSHIYLEAFHRGRWIPLDATMPYPMGWSPRTFVKKIVAIERKSDMMHQNPELQGLAANTLMELRGLIQTVRDGGLRPKDARVRSLWNLLRQRNLLVQSPWLQGVLRHLWERGLSMRARPYTARRLARLLRRWGILPSFVRSPTLPVTVTQPLPAIAVRRVRPVTVRPLLPVKATPISRLRR